MGSLLVLLGGFIPTSVLFAREDPAPSPPAARVATAAQRGYQSLLETPLLPAAFDQETFDNVWRVWPESLREQARGASEEERRRLAFERYGLTPRPGDASSRPLQYVVDDAGRWSMNCLACHGGQVAGRVIPGLPNSHLALQTFAEEIRDTKRLLQKPLTPGDLAIRFIPLGTTNGTTNAVMFSVSLLNFRNRDLDRTFPRRPPRFVHHDMDAPPWWTVRKRTHLYLTGFAPKAARPLMQFTLVPTVPGDVFRARESEFEDILAYIESLPVPVYPFEVDPGLAETGHRIFRANCSSCHGTYGAEPTYPNRRVPIDVVGTDRLRVDAITKAQRAKYAESWLTNYDPTGVVLEPGGYVAPPLDGVWATAPYLHNGSVPTLWHVLHPTKRPSLWRRTLDGYDQERVGLEIEVLAEMPREARADAKLRRTIFDTTQRGKSADGHTFPDRLSETQKRAVLEYLKTL